jgi:pyruvate dehydrogenase E2 component (dihydrolipoamide acetyltransferase)
MDFFVKASALSMKAVPDINSSWQETFVRQYHQVDINVVIGAGRSVSIPVIRDVSSKGLKSISQELADFEDTIYSEDGKLLDPSKVAVGTFSIHNLGAFGIKSAAPIVLPPQACSLAIGAITDTVVPRVYNNTIRNINIILESEPLFFFFVGEFQRRRR